MTNKIEKLASRRILVEYRESQTIGDLIEFNPIQVDSCAPRGHITMMENYLEVLSGYTSTKEHSEQTRYDQLNIELEIANVKTWLNQKKYPI